LYDAYAPRIYRYIFFKVSSSSEAEDLTADVFLKTWEFIQKREERISSFQPFVYRLARNAVVDHYRNRAKEAAVMSLDFSIDVAEQVDKSLPTKIAIASDVETVMKAMNTLKDEYREIILLRYIEEYSIFETAKILEKSRGAVRTTTHRAIEALREAVTQLEPTQ
jgi:RNA polymerase sigma-70 factor (ECF subfamily)